MARPSTTYDARTPGQDVLYRIVRDHFETFRTRADALREGDGLPRFVEQAFREYLRCGWLAGGFARFRCDGCGFDRLVPFSCKGRALCPSCGGRRMAERAAHLVDHVLPHVPVRQWVLSVPYRLRYLLAWNHDLCRATAAILARSVFRVLADRARDAGVEGTRGGAVVVIQRFGGALNLNVHFHALVLDGVFASGDAADPEFHPTRRLTALDVAEVLAAVEALVARRLQRMGHFGSADAEEGAAELFGDGVSSLAALAAAAVEGRVALGPRPGTRVTRTGLSRAPTDVATGARCHAESHGYSLHAGLVVPRGQRARLERVCRYVLRPPVAADRIALTGSGQVRLRLRQPWRDGTTGFVFDPVDFLGRLAVLVPRPLVNLILYYGVLGARSAWRPGVPAVRSTAPDAGRLAGAVVYDAAGADRACADTAANRARARQWAALMQRTFGFDVLECPRCAGRLRLVAVIEASGVVRRILMHLGLPAEVPVPRPARAPPLLDEVHDVRDWHEQPGSGFDT